MPYNNNTLHIQSLLTVVPPVNDVCSTGVGAGAGVGAGEHGWATAGCLLAEDEPFMNCYNNISIIFRIIKKTFRQL